MNALMTVLYFLFSLFFNIVIYALWIRLGLHFLKFSTLHPVSQLIYTITNPLVNPIKKLLSKKQQMRTAIDWSTVITLIIMEFLKFVLIGLFFFGQLFPIIYILIFMIADLLVQPLNLLFYMILIRVIMSWIQPDWRHPVNDVLRAFTNPLLRLGHSLVPNISGFDFSPFIILILLKVLTLFISASLPISLI